MVGLDGVIDTRVGALGGEFAMTTGPLSTQLLVMAVSVARARTFQWSPLARFVLASVAPSLPQSPHVAPSALFAHWY